MRDSRYVLLDDGTIIEDLRDVVAGRANQLHSPLESLMVRLAADERGQKRMMNVDDPLRIRTHELRRKNLHVASENDEVHRLPLQQSQNLALRRLLFFLLNRHQVKRNAIKLCNGLAIRMIRNYAWNIARQLSTLMAIE